MISPQSEINAHIKSAFEQMVALWKPMEARLIRLDSQLAEQAARLAELEALVLAVSDHTLARDEKVHNVLSELKKLVGSKQDLSAEQCKYLTELSAQKCRRQFRHRRRRQVRGNE